uniref:At4g15545-like C-terminal domain-containing protein n=1 Tax=Chromera velia CCMP2878 TaxID=1169474 RepID=A0A0G4FIP5_9ALVE|eukprot:Cvel_17253.t1-p1 / transcript=Cvel_17253.t1 / gene=Cvel_17253 / organism=Chromera_velia_CCMP2878 / gene_product=Uncharacterized protein At4g15545, putative / transcript_product=Uncharacterized protein At4g15545, putative / location=Cvel_scaffold1366:42290-43111(+) / protein_length=274 / sequence_SO=supercontig / SO=protein_coding / is_pseudo=false
MDGQQRTDRMVGWLPSDAEEQLELGWSVISHAFKQKWQDGQTEIEALKAENERLVKMLEKADDRSSALEEQLQRANDKSSQLVSENQNLVYTIKRLQKDVQRLENLKKVVLSQIQEDTDTIAFPASNTLRAVAAQTAQAQGGHTHTVMPSGHTNQHFVMSKPAESHMPATISAPLPAGAGRSGNGRSQPEMYPPTSQTATGAAETVAAVDGKEFFRVARSALSYESFNRFLSVIRQLNNRELSRDATLEHAKGIFGKDQPELLESFRMLLMRHM